MNTTSDTQNRLSFLPRRAAWILFGLLVASAILFAARRLAGGFTEAASPAWIALTGVGLAVIVYLIRRGLPNLNEFGTVLPHVPTLAAAVIGLSIWMPGSSLYAVGLFWVFLLFGDAVHWTASDERSPKPRMHSVTTFLAPEESPETSEPALPEEDASLLPEEPLQERLVRSQTEEGRERVEGTVRIRFEPGQRIGHAHIPFCPAFVSVPQFECEQIEGPEGRIKPTQVQPFGARVEAKLAEDAGEAGVVWVGFWAVEGEGLGSRD